MIQNPVAVKEFIPIDLETIKKQIFILQNYYDIQIVNIGLLGSLDILDFIIPLFEKTKIIWDPILSSGSGDFQFIKEDQFNRLMKHFNNIFLLTPNLPEASALSGQKIQNFTDIQKASRILMEFGAKNVLIKGGHLRGKVIYDTLFENDQVSRFYSSPKEFRIHGTGSFLNATISTYLFSGDKLRICIEKAKHLLNRAVEEVDEENPVLNVRND